MSDNFLDLFNVFEKDLVFQPCDRVQTVDGEWLTIKDIWIEEDETTGLHTLTWGVEENENSYLTSDFVARKLAPKKS